MRWLILIVLAHIPATAGAAHEWRTAWAGPAVLVALESEARPPGELRAALLTSRPYGVADLNCHGMRLTLLCGRIDLHAGALMAGAYREWHAGIGGWLACGGGLEIFAGLRAFGLVVPDRPARPVATGSVGLRFGLPGLPAASLQIGAIDLSGQMSQVAPVIQGRLTWCGGGLHLACERAEVIGSAPETAVLMRWLPGAVGLLQAYRFGIGEATLGLVIRVGGLEVVTAQRWHPALGWTPRVSVAWLRPEVP